MAIAVMSDLHDNIVAWRSLLNYLHQTNIERLINCGDTCSPATLELMSEDFSGQIDTIFGNVADREREVSVSKKLRNVTHHGDAGVITIEGITIFLNHFPHVAERTARTGTVDLACHGHTHFKRWEPIGTTMILNPGTAGGMFQYPSFATIDLETMKCSFIDLTL